MTSLDQILARATRATTTITACTDRAALRAWHAAHDAGDHAAAERHAAQARDSRITITITRATPAARAAAITRITDPSGDEATFSETVLYRRLTAITGSAITLITSPAGDEATGPLTEDEATRLRDAIGETAWAQLRDFATGEDDEDGLDPDFSPAPSGETPA